MEKSRKHSEILSGFACVCLLLFSSCIFGTISPQVEAHSVTPIGPFSHRVLVCARPIYAANTLCGDVLASLSKYGYNVTLFQANPAAFLDNPVTQDLDVYDVVILWGIYIGSQPCTMNASEVRHFTNWDGVLVLVSSAMMRNETRGNWWTDWDASPVTNVEARFGVVWGGCPNTNAANSTLHRQTNSIPNLPESIPFTVKTQPPWLYPPLANTVSLNGATEVYNMSVGGVEKPAITYYQNGSGAVGIYFNAFPLHSHSIGSYPYADYLRAGFVDSNFQRIGDEARLLHGLLAYALGSDDSSTFIKPQQFAVFRVDDVPVYTGMNDSECVWALDSMKTAAETYKVGISIATMTNFPNNYHDFWAMASQSDYALNPYLEWGSHFQHTDFRKYTKQQCLDVIHNEIGNFSERGLPKFSTTICPVGTEVYNTQSMRQALYDTGLYVFDLTQGDQRTEDGILVHGTFNFGTAARFSSCNETKIFNMFHNYGRKQWMLVPIARGEYGDIYTHYASFIYGEVGNYQVYTLQSNMSFDIPDVRFSTLREAGLYFGLKWAKIQSLSEIGDVITFAVNVDNVPSLTNIGKGMLWYRINTSSSQTIRSVKVDGSDWHLFDDHSVRIPASNCNVEVTLGTPITPHIKETDRIITATSYTGSKLTFRVKSLTGTLSTTKVFCGLEGEPREVIGASSWSYDSPAKLLTIIVSHSSEQEVAIEFGSPHDIAVTDITPSKTVVGQGYSVSINATVENLGAFPESVNVTAYANGSIIGTLNMIIVESGNSVNITFSWNTMGFAKGNYSISAYAWPVLGEIHTEDNSYVDGTVVVAIVGDINADGIVNVIDLATIGRSHGTTKGDYLYAPNADINDDGIIDIADMATCAYHYLETDP